MSSQAEGPCVSSEQSAALIQSTTQFMPHLSQLPGPARPRQGSRHTPAPPSAAAPAGLPVSCTSSSGLASPPPLAGTSRSTHRPLPRGPTALHSVRNTSIPLEFDHFLRYDCSSLPPI